jgi:hypothetical protein
MLSPNELSVLYKIISDENQTFENISQSFSESFKKCDQLKVATSLCILIKDNLLNIHQRLISFYLIYLMKKNDDLEITPFLPFIIETIKTSKNKNEQFFLSDFLNNQINYLNTSVKNYIEDNTKTVKIKIQDLQNLCNKYYLEQSKIGNNKKNYDYLRHVLYDRKKSDIKNVDNHLNSNLAKSINVDDELAFKYFVPNYMSFCPMNMISNQSNNSGNGCEIFDTEPIWLLPNLKHNFIWENGKLDNDKEEGEKK